MSPSLCLPSSFHRVPGLLRCAAAAVIALSPLTASADVNAVITQKVWKMKWAVSDAQMNNPAWADQDDDADGVSNGAEVGAGTNPFSPFSTVKISGMVLSGNEVQLSFPTVAWKNYTVQSTATLADPQSWLKISGASVIGNGAAKTLVVPWQQNRFYRVIVEELDTDGDGASDWAEVTAGYKRDNANTNGAQSDGEALLAAVNTPTTVTVTTTKNSAAQPSDAASAPAETGAITLTRTSPLEFNSITVPLQVAGTAALHTDYELAPVVDPQMSVTFPPGVTQVVLGVNPLHRPAQRTNVTAIVKALPGNGYTLAGSTSGMVVINPAGIANGTGLTAQYHNTSNSTYATQQGIFNAAPELERVDATINFTNPTNGWGSAAGPTGMNPVSTNGAFSVRWIGQVLPQYSEVYSILARTDDGVRVWINGELLIDRWISQGATDMVSTINLKGGVLYDIQMDYFNAGTGSAVAQLSWWSESQPRQIIPQNRLFPAVGQAQKPTTLINSLTATGYTGVPFSFAVVSPKIGGTVTYSLDANSNPLPPGLTLNSTTGEIGGTPSTAGEYTVAINAVNAAGVGGSDTGIRGSTSLKITIFPTGSVTREILAANGTVTPDGTVATVDDDTDGYAANTARRLRGYIVPPKTGNYYFWLAGNDAAELWISRDSEFVNRVKRAWITSGTGKRTWNAVATQRSPWIYLVEGRKYYFDVLHNTGTAGDQHISMGWCQDDVGTVISVAGDANGAGARTLIPNGGGALQGYPLSGVVPSYIFQPFDYPSNVTSSGALYAANLGPQGSAATKASGSANLRVDPSGTSAVLHFKYQGLTTPRTAYHLHVDAFDSHTQGEIVYDIDDIDSFHPELRTADGGYIWNFTTGGTFTSIAQIQDAIARGKVYLNVHSVNYPNGEIRGTLQVVEGSQTPPDPALYAEPTTPADDPANPAHAARFLHQASFGASPSDVAYVQANGFEAWIDDQLTKPNSRTSNDVVAGLTADINVPYPSSLFTDAWWKYSVTGPDQLRQRLAFALSEILVVSWQNNTGPLQNNGRVIADYYDNLVDYCLPTAGLPDSGNFRGVLKSVTLTPAMGLYLDMRGNQKADYTLGRHPNENYAREILQLFSAGLNRMWDDGKLVLNSNADVIPVYAQAEILGFSALFTGWNYAQNNQGNGRLPSGFSPAQDFLNPMVLVPTRHDLGPKLLLNSIVAPPATGLTPRIAISGISATSPCVITTNGTHGLTKGDTIRIAGVTGGSFRSPVDNSVIPINAHFAVSEVLTPTTFRVPANCLTVPTVTSATVTGANVRATTLLNTTALAAVTGSQADNAGATLPHPYDQYGLNELEMAIDNIMDNDNVAPFVCRQLIQRLVTSDPSPGYLYRVVQKWRNNGSGARGDLRAVLKQILLDREARSAVAAAANPKFGKQREPMLRLTATARAFPAEQYTGTYRQLEADTANAHRLRVTTSRVNDFSSGFTASLNFRGNYTTTTPPNPYDNPTTTTYGIQGTLAIASTFLDIVSIQPVASQNKTTITTATAHGLVDGNTVTISGVSGKFTGTINATHTIADATATTFTVPVTTTHVFQVTNVAVGSPNCVVTAPSHGLPAVGTVTGVTLTGINGGAFSTGINATNLIATRVDDNTFTVATSGSTPIACSSPPTSYTTWRHVSSPLRIRTVEKHGLVDGDAITISGVSGGTYVSFPAGGPTPNINDSVSRSVVRIDDFAFRLTDVGATAASSNNTGAIVGGNTLDVNATGMVNVTYSQPAGSNVLTVNTNGPQTNVAIPNPVTAGTTIKSKVYLDFLSATARSTAGIASVGFSAGSGSPAQITTSTPHGLATGDSVTISGVTGGTFNPGINSTYVVTVTGANSFTVQSACTRPSLASISTGNPCTVTTTAPHGLASGNSIAISGVSGGTFSTSINATFTATVTSPTTFTVPVNCTAAPTISLGALSGTHGTTPADGIYAVDSNASTTSFTVLTADTPTASRTGSVIIPRISSSYTPMSSNSIVQYNTNVNHSVRTAPATTVWVDIPIVGTPVYDGEYLVSEVTDEDHFRTSWQPVSSVLSLSTNWPRPSGSQNGATIYPLAPPPMGRSGSVTINQSTFNLGSTEGTLSQSPMNSPTVFNFFYPDYKFPGKLANNGLDSPEFQLSTDSNLSNLTNSLTNMFVSGSGGNSNLNGLSSFNNGSGSIVVDIGSYLVAAKTRDPGIDGLIDELANLLVGGPLDPLTKDTIKKFVTGKRITAISTGNPVQITCPDHGLATGNPVTISGLSGGTFSPSLNNGTFTATVLDANRFTVPVNCTSISGLNLSSAGIPLNFPINLTTTPNNQQMRDRVRAIIHLIVTTAEFAVQK